MSFYFFGLRPFSVCFSGRRTAITSTPCRAGAVLRLLLLGLAVAIALPTFAVTRRVNEYGWRYFLRYGPIYWLSPETRTEVFRQGDYRVCWYRDRRDPANPGFRVTYGGRTVFDMDGLDDYSGELYRDTLFPLGADITGTGHPNFRLSSWLGENTAVHWVLELVDGGVDVVFHEEGGLDLDLVDANGDGVAELELFVPDHAAPAETREYVWRDGAYVFVRRTVHDP